MQITAAESRRKWRSRIYEICIFAMLGSLMFCSKIIMEALPNVHLLGMFTMLCAIVFRFKGLIPIYLYVFLNGLYAGFDLWWFPYLYIWTILWGITMLIPRKIPPKVAAFVYPAVCALHGLLFGALYAPAYAIMYDLDFNELISWIIAGIPYDIMHCVGDAAAGLLVLPLSQLLPKLMKKR